ncbi:Hypothetical predicted protein [Lecanosticta acicola]|uniref:T6SS Phospholipase effector Tle1-like catalytic domain-containing protein n=1 Tax=Lecanosticta acicola TaxID=111012 RepID=A0AAI9E8N5_9PEZI|nr:Hypothetical predicted protein [Lecanosticta acicola]
MNLIDHYYQPGIGTYVESSSLSRKSHIGRIKSWYAKAKDQAIGTSFGEHVMAGYKFLMRYYNDGDAIYFFGFSRGAYTARFLAQMLDYVGLLSAGNEEMLRFAWKTFSRWQMRNEDSASGKHKKKETFEFMKKFRETFSRPVCRIEFLGLFDCVNSVPQFESAWMSRTRFPYTAKTSARVIRHAVSIDERRAKFRQDLISERRQAPEQPGYKDYIGDYMHMMHRAEEDKEREQGDAKEEPKQNDYSHMRPRLKKSHDTQTQMFRSTRRRLHLPVTKDNASASEISVNSQTIVTHRQHDRNAEEGHPDDDDDQDILEVWFAGQHGDIGGGWPLGPEEDRPLSDIALMWMLREARKAGMPFDEDKVRASNMFLPAAGPGMGDMVQDAPLLQVDGQPVPQSPRLERNMTPTTFTDEVHRIATRSRVHDSLSYKGGLGWLAVSAWQFMEWLPFRRMDLQQDGSWRAISWPLPRGEVRDMSNDCKIHHSVVKRMQADPNYRPGNLIVGGGGRGVRVAPKHYGMGSWKVVHEPGDVVGEAYVREVEDDDDITNGKMK